MNQDKVEQIKNNLLKSLTPLIAPGVDRAAEGFKHSLKLLEECELALGLTPNYQARMERLSAAIEDLSRQTLPEHLSNHFALEQPCSHEALADLAARRVEAISKLELLQGVADAIHTGQSPNASVARDEGVAQTHTDNSIEFVFTSRDLGSCLSGKIVRVHLNSFDKTREEQEQLARDAGSRFATRPEHHAFVEYLLQREQQGTPNPQEVTLLSLYRTKFLRDSDGGLDIRDDRACADKGGWDSIAHPSSGAIFVEGSASEEHYFDNESSTQLQDCLDKLRSIVSGITKTTASETAACDDLEGLIVQAAEHQGTCSTLTPRDLFVAKYNIQVHGPHEVSFVLPKGVSRYEMLREAQGLGLRNNRDLVYPDRLETWQKDPVFQKSSDAPERIRIDGHVQGGDGKKRATQEALVKSRGLTLPSLEDLAAAFVAHYVATGEPLFGWFDNNSYTYVVRAAGGALDFNRHGLNVCDIYDDGGYSYVAVAARVPRN